MILKFTDGKFISTPSLLSLKYYSISVKQSFNSNKPLEVYP